MRVSRVDADRHGLVDAIDDVAQMRLRIDGVGRIGSDMSVLAGALDRTRYRFRQPADNETEAKLPECQVGLSQFGSVLRIEFEMSQQDAIV